MALTDRHSPGATPLRPEDLRGLKLLHITTYADLNEAEAANIIAGQEWALRTRTSDLPSMLSDDYLQQLHDKMYGEVWKWAGTYRTHDTSAVIAAASKRRPQSSGRASSNTARGRHADIP